MCFKRQMAEIYCKMWEINPPIYRSNKKYFDLGLFQIYFKIMMKIQETIFLDLRERCLVISD